METLEHGKDDSLLFQTYCKSNHIHLHDYAAIQGFSSSLCFFSQHRVSSFRLKDDTKPGHRRFLALWLVDPHERIVSTANVPPQQKDWWIDVPKGEKGSQVQQNDLWNEVSKAEDGSNVPDSLMTVEEAQEHRLRLMHERSRNEAKAEQTVTNTGYNFCEH